MKTVRGLCKDKLYPGLLVGLLAVLVRVEADSKLCKLEWRWTPSCTSQSGDGFNAVLVNVKTDSKLCFLE